MSQEGHRDALHNLCLADAVWAERYEGWTLLGRGGSASVVRTHGKAVGEDLALKVFHRLSPDDWRRFRQEVGTAQRLTSPHVVRTYSAFPRGSLAWIEMELVDGPDLRQELERRVREAAPFTRDEAMDVAAAVAGALVAAHEKGVVHRDVKPANILLPRSGAPVAKLGDFGISRLAGAARVTQTGLLAGTPQFAAPEVVAGQPATAASDVYSLSLCLYLLLSRNRFPFELTEESSAAQWLRAQVDQPPLPIETFDPGLPTGLSALVHRGLAKDPAARPTSVQLQEALTGLRGTAVRVAAPLTPPLRPPRMGWRLAAAGGLVLVFAAVVVSWRPTTPEPRPAAPVTVSATPAPEAPNQPGVRWGPQTPTSPEARPAAARPIPLPAPAPSHVPASARPSLFRATVSGGLVTVVNTGPASVADLSVTLVGSDGKSHTATVPGALAPGEEVSLPVDAFVPAPPPGLRATRIEVAAADPPEARATTTIRPQ